MWLILSLGVDALACDEQAPTSVTKLDPVDAVTVVLPVPMVNYPAQAMNRVFMFSFNPATASDVPHPLGQVSLPLPRSEQTSAVMGQFTLSIVKPPQGPLVVTASGEGKHWVGKVYGCMRCGNSTAYVKWTDTTDPVVLDATLGAAAACTNYMVASTYTLLTP